MPDPTSTAANDFFDEFRSTRRDKSSRRSAYRRALADRVHHAKADSEAALRRATTALDDSRQLVDDTHRRLASARKRR